MPTNDTDHRLFGEYLHWIAHKELALGAVRALAAAARPAL